MAAVYAALPLHDALYVLGACRVWVLSGAVSCAGAVLTRRQGATLVVAPGHDVWLPITAVGAVACSPDAVVSGASGGDSGIVSFIASKTTAPVAVVSLGPHPAFAAYAVPLTVAASHVAAQPAVNAMLPGAVVLPCHPSSTGAAAGGVILTTWPRPASGALLAPPAPAAVVAAAALNSRVLTESKAWSAAMQDGRAVLCRGGVVAAVGGKGSGKSTWLRGLVNAYVTAPPPCPSPLAATAGQLCAVLDGDVGQPEHGMPGCVTLSLVVAPILTPPHLRAHHAFNAVAAWSSVPVPSPPPHTHASSGGDAVAGGPLWQWVAATRAAVAGMAPTGMDPITPVDAVLNVASVFVGGTTVKADPDGYIAAMLACWREWHRVLHPWGVPLVINTHGWIKGSGWDVTFTALAAMQPACVAVMEAAPMPGVRANAGAGGLVSALQGTLPAANVHRVPPTWRRPVEGDGEGDGLNTSAQLGGGGVGRVMEEEEGEEGEEEGEEGGDGEHANPAGDETVKDDGKGDPMTNGALDHPAPATATATTTPADAAASTGRGDLEAAGTADARANGHDGSGEVVEAGAAAHTRSTRSPASLRAARWMAYFCNPQHTLSLHQHASSTDAGSVGAGGMDAALVTVFHRILADHRIAHAPSVGTASPAWAWLTAAMPLYVRVARLWVHPRLGSPPMCPAPCHMVEGLVGRVVAFTDAHIHALSHDGASSVSRATATAQPSTCAPPPTMLPWCWGYGYVVRHIPKYQIVVIATPLPRHLFAAHTGGAAGAMSAAHGEVAEVEACVVAWDGACDLPVQLLYRDDPTDEYTAAADAIVDAASGGGKAMAGRNTLKRMRLSRGARGGRG